MPKNVSITLDGQAKTITGATKIQTCLEDGGNCLWIPKDDVPLTTLTVTEDGTYYPPENYYGFSEVIADGVGTTQMGELIEKTVDKNGTYNIGDESGSPYGYSKFTVNVDLSEDSEGGGDDPKPPVVGKDEDGNDEMVDTDDDGNIVMTALPTDIKVIIPPTKLEYNRYETIDYSGISVYAYISKMVHWLGTTTTAISEGLTNNTIIVDGESVSASIGDGATYSPAPAVTYRFVWDGTKWIKPENYSAEKAFWKSEDYPSGKIPFEELIFPKKIANSNDITDEIKKTSMSSELIGVRKIKMVNSFSWSYAYTDSFSDSYELVFARINASDAKMASFGDGLIVIASSDENFRLTINVEHLFYNDHFTDYAAQKGSINFKYYIIGPHPGRYDNDIEDFILVHNAYYIHYNERTKKESYSSAFDRYVNRNAAFHADSYSPIDLGNIYIERDNYTFDNKTVCYTALFPGIKTRNLVLSVFGDTAHDAYSNSYNLRPIERLAWTMIYGHVSEESNIYSITLPVQWKRPGDGKILETTFTAWMKDEESDDGEQQPQPAPTPAPG